MLTDNDSVVFLENCFDKEVALSEILTRDRIRELSRNEDPEIRSLLAKVLVFDFTTEENVEILSHLAKDCNTDVRLEAVDSLSVYPHQGSWETLCLLLEDNDEYVRAYAAYGVGTVGKVILSKESVAVLRKMQRKEHSPYVCVAILESLYVLGEQTELPHLLKLFESDDYHTRCCVLRALANILNKNNRELIEAFLNKIDNTKLSIAEMDAATELKNALKTA